MSAAPYSIETVDLSVVTTTPRELVRPGRAISSIAVLVLASGAEFKLHMGPGGGAIPCVAQGFQLRAKPRRDPQGNCTYPSAGLYASVERVFATTATVLVTYGDEGLLELSGGGTVATPPLPPIAEGAKEFQPGSVNDTSTIWLVNPALSGKVFRVYSFRGWTADSGMRLFITDYAAGAGAGGIITETTERWQDRRKASDAAPVGQVRGVNFADDVTRALTLADMSLRVINTVNPPDHITEMLSPSSAYYLKSPGSMILRGVANGAGVTLGAAVLWDESQ